MIWFNRGRAPAESDGDARVVAFVYIIRSLDGVTYRTRDGRVPCFSDEAEARDFLGSRVYLYRILKYQLKELRISGLKVEELVCIR